jgi:hypothetical protein
MPSNNFALKGQSILVGNRLPILRLKIHKVGNVSPKRCVGVSRLGINLPQTRANPRQRGMNPWQRGMNPWQRGMNPWQRGMNPRQTGAIPRQTEAKLVSSVARGIIAATVLILKTKD